MLEQDDFVAPLSMLMLMLMLMLTLFACAAFLQSVVLYWVSSATFGLLQSWIFDYFDKRRSDLRRLPQSVLPPDSAATRDKPAQARAPVPKPKRR
jgi:membrane protein insertase Oxa1/YidC/SpoIIIJ